MLFVNVIMAGIAVAFVLYTLVLFHALLIGRNSYTMKREFEIRAWADNPEKVVPLSDFLKHFGDFDNTMRLYSSIDPDDSYPRIYMEYTGPGMGYIQIIDTLKGWSKTEKIDFDIREKEAPKSWKDHVKRATLYEITGGRVTNMREGYFK